MAFIRFVSAKPNFKMPFRVRPGESQQARTGRLNSLEQAV